MIEDDIEPLDHEMDTDGEGNSKEPDVEPECSASEKEREEIDIKCEFIVKDGQWWCDTHNCSA